MGCPFVFSVPSPGQGAAFLQAWSLPTSVHLTEGPSWGRRRVLAGGWLVAGGAGGKDVFLDLVYQEQGMEAINLGGSGCC